MARSATLYAALSSDAAFRRVVLPILLFASSVFRYNLLSLLYFTAMLISLVLPGTRRSIHRIPNFALSFLLIVVSSIGTLGQPLFQISLATDYNDTYCTHDEKIWRQCGFVQFDVNAADVIRHLLPDIVILVTSILSFLSITMVALTQMWQTPSPGGDPDSVDKQRSLQTISSSMAAAEDYHSLNVEKGFRTAQKKTSGHSSKRSSAGSIQSVNVEKQEMSSSSLSMTPGYSFGYLATAWNFSFVLLLWLVGVCVASVLNFPYFVLSIYLASCWALRFNNTRIYLVAKKGITMVISLYSAVHLIILYLYQFQSVQDLVPRPSVTARVLGLVGLVRTNCDNPTKLHVHDGLEWPEYLGPISILLLYCVTLSDVRYWLFFEKKQLQLLPLSMSETRQKKQPSVEQPSTTLLLASGEEEDMCSSVADSSVVKKKGSRWQRFFSHDGVAGWLLQLARNAIVKSVGYFVEINFVLTLASTMVWSLMFPSWPAFVLLMWSCIVWVTPRFNAKDTVYYTTPLLVLYAIVLLLIQYLYNLDLTERELESNIYAGLARYHGPPAGARVLTIALKSLFTAVFMCSLREFIYLYKHRLQRFWHHFWHRRVFHHSRHRGDDIEARLIAASPPTADDGGLSGAYAYMKRYWLVVTTIAFLLVSLVGDVTFFKMVYMLFFLLFLLCYEVFPRYYYSIMKPVWTVLIFYAFMELILIYTYQFSYIRHKWRDALNEHRGHFTTDEILQSIGFFEVSIESLSFTNVKDLFETLVPPALFVAVMALQLKYFSPLNEREEAALAHYSIQAGEDGMEHQQYDELDHTNLTVFDKLKKYVNIFIEFCWRFLEIYLDKIIVIVTFILVLQQVSSTHLITLLILLGPIVGLRAKRLWYPLLTLYIGTLIMLKMLYQVRMVEPHSFDLSDSCPGIKLTNSTSNPVSGEVFHYKHSPQENDPAWFGFFKVECEHCGGFQSYIKTHIVLVLLLACSYSVQRRQDRYRLRHLIAIPAFDKTALFWGITIDEADQSLFKTAAYLVSHLFDFYGTEFCWCMLAMNVAVRIDVYGVVYAGALGVLLIIPRRRLLRAWMVYILIHGGLLVIQYLMVLNTPYGACIQDQRDDKDFPWSKVEPLRLKRWLWLPLSSDNVVILNKDWLWADFFTFVLICSESFSLRQRLAEASLPRISTTRLTFLSFAEAEILLDHIKRMVFNHSYWVTLFVILAAGVAQVSILGVVYLFACFVLLWFSGSMSLLRQRTLKYRWFFLLMVVWSVLLLKISLQLLTCVYYKTEFDNDCVVTRIFNAQCGAHTYYGMAKPEEDCANLPRHVGLWLDVFAFIAIVVQLILSGTIYWELIRQFSTSKFVATDSNWVTGALLNKINGQISKNRQREKKIKEQIRKRILEVKQKYHTSVMEHYLRAGVILPRNVKFIGEDKALLHDRDILVSKDAGDDDITMTATMLSPSASMTSIVSEEDIKKEEGEEEFHRAGVWRALGIVADLVDSALVVTITWLHNTSTYYYYLLERLEVQQLELSQNLHHVPTSVSDHLLLVPAVTVTEEETGTEELPVSSTSDDSIFSIDDVDYDHIVFYSKERVYQTLGRISKRPMELLQALYHAIVANTEYICYLLVVINVTLNGSVLALVYAALMFLWGLLSFPWPTKRFWLTITFYTMFVILVKYGFQFQQVDWAGSPDAGLYWPRVLGIEKKDDFFKNTVCDILLLIFLFIHRGILLESGRWDISGYFAISTFSDTDGANAIKLIFKNRNELANKSVEVEAATSSQNCDASDDEDEDDITEDRFIILLMKNAMLNVKYFYHQILCPHISLEAHNYYTLSFIVDSISFVIIAVGFSSFGAEEDEGLTAVADYIQENNVPIPFLMMLFAHFMSMVIDRAIYLRKSIAAKLIFFLFQLFIWHLWLFFILPASPVTDKAFTDNGFAQALYFFKCMYFILSAQQCVAGFPKRVLGYFISKQYNIVASVIFKVYRSIPLLPELKEVMDWMFTPTSLALSHWLKVQEIWAMLYIIKNKRRWEKSDPRMLGHSVSFLVKLFIGGGLLALLILLIWGPLLIIALLNTTNVSNPPVEVTIKLSIGSFEPLLTMRVDEQDIKMLNDAQFTRLRNDYATNKQQRKRFEHNFKQRDFRYVTFSGKSTALWQISPPSRIAMEYLLDHETSFVPLVFSWNILREPETGLASESVTGEVIRRLYRSKSEGNQTRQEILNLLRSPKSNSAVLANLFPQYIYAPANGPSEDLAVLSRGRGVDCTASLQVKNITVTQTEDNSPVSIVSEWWSLTQNSSHRVVSNQPGDVEFIIYSERISNPEFSFISGLGIIGLYVSIVLVVGGALRTYVARLPSQIKYDEIPNPDSLLELCDDIFYVREDKRLQEEEILVGRLFFTFRSSVRLIEETRWKLD